MNRKIFYTLIVSIFFNCESDSLDEANNSLQDQDLIVSYNSEIASIMSVNCISCHSNPPVNGAGIPLSTYSQVKESIDLVLNRIQRKPGDPKLMPIGGAKLPQNKINLIQKWKDDGLKN